MRRARGFTLIEIMVALALAGLVVAGAIQLHVAFNRQAGRQQAIAEMQQSLRVAMQILERAIRTAGQGLPSSHTIKGFTTSCASYTYYDFQFSNSNTYTDPPASYWNPAVQDTDPDWFRVIASDTTGDSGATIASVTVSGVTPTQVKFFSNTSQSWAVGDLFAVVPDPSPPPFPPTIPPSPAGACQIPYQVTTFTAASSPGVIGIGATSCYNQVLNNNCLANLWTPPNSNLSLVAGAYAPTTSSAPSLRHIANGFGTVYRIMPPSEQGTNAQLTPKLTMRSAPFGTLVNDTNYPWTVLADNIEDMQIAVILTDGTVCNNRDTPSTTPSATTCDFTTASAVRVTLVARSPTPLQGAPPSPKGGYEDELVQAAPNPPDYLLRRSMTATIVLRNLSQ